MCRKKTLAKIAYQYYIDGRSQNEIAKELNVNRATISRMLKEARDSKIVSIEIDGHDEKVLALEAYLKQKFNLKSMIIAYTPEGESTAAKSECLYKEAADYIQRIIKNGDNVGLTWGKTVSKVITHINGRHTKQVTILPLAGGPSPANVKYHVNSIIHELGTKFSAQCRYINTQVIQEKNKPMKSVFTSQAVNDLLPYWNNLDVAVVGIGGTLKQKNKWREVLSPEDLEELKLREAVGDCCCQFFDGDGKILKGELYKRTISIPLEYLSKAKFSIGIAANKNKAKAIYALLKQRYINVLITDYETALQIVELIEKDSVHKIMV